MKFSSFMVPAGVSPPHWWKKDTPLSMMLNAKQDLPHASMHL
jgi:hypothetical protein